MDIAWFSTLPLRSSHATSNEQKEPKHECVYNASLRVLEKGVASISQHTAAGPMGQQSSPYHGRPIWFAQRDDFSWMSWKIHFVLVWENHFRMNLLNRENKKNRVVCSSSREQQWNNLRTWFFHTWNDCSKTPHQKLGFWKKASYHALHVATSW